MVKIFSWILAVGLIFSCAQAFAKDAPIYDKDNATFVKEFNRAAKKFGNFKMGEFKYEMTLDDCDLYDAIIEGAGKEISEAVVRQNEDKKIARFTIVVDNIDASRQLFKAALATFKIEDMPYRSMDELIVKNAEGKTLKVSVDFYKDDTSETYSFTIRT